MSERPKDLIYALDGALMFVAGIQIVASRPITLRASLIVGFSILLGLSVLIFPEFYKALPVGWTHQFTDSEITVAVISSVTLNALFLVGTWHHAQLRLGGDDRQRQRRRLMISSSS